MDGLSRIFWFGFWISDSSIKTRGPKMSARQAGYVGNVGGAKQAHVNARPDVECVQMWVQERNGGTNERRTKF